MSSEEETLPEPTHDWVAKKMGYSISGVSLIRNGKRRPHFATMETVEEAFKWPIYDQIDARRENRYHTEFNKVVAKKLAEEKESKENG